MDIKRVLEHIVYFEHTGPTGEELPLDAPVPIRDDPLYVADDQLVAMLAALKELDAPGETLELRVRRHDSSSWTALAQITMEGTARYDIRVAPTAALSSTAHKRLLSDGFQPVAGADGGSEWLLVEYRSALDTLPSFLDELFGYVLGYKDDYDVEEA